MNKYILLGIGNRLRCDDGAGSILAERLGYYNNNTRWIAIDCMTMPENYTSVVRRENPDKVVLVDACNINLAPGMFRIVDIELLSNENGFNTHSAPLTMFIKYLKQLTKEVIFIGIQPKSIDFDTEISDEINVGINKLLDILINEEFSSIKKLYK